ncbi:putative sulfate exporter family transporter [Pseudoalteromonas sp. B193]
MRVGIVLLGTRIALGDLVTLGWQTALMLAGAIFTTIILGVVLARIWLTKTLWCTNRWLGCYLWSVCCAGYPSIMPNSEHKERDTLLTVIGVTAMSTIAMILYPIVVNYLEFDAHNAGVFLGGTIHDVAQVVGAGYSVSPETGDIATLTKLVRVAMLLPVVLIMMVVINHSNKEKHGELPKVPGFLIGFVILMVINSCFSVPTIVLETANELSQFFLIAAISAIGMKTNLGKLTEVGMKPIILIVAETLWIALLILGFVIWS